MGGKNNSSQSHKRAVLNTNIEVILKKILKKLFIELSENKNQDTKTKEEKSV